MTVREVAERAGVSTATVSRVLSGRRPTRPDVAEKVRSAAFDLGYVPNQVARALRDRRTATIGLIVPDITNPFFPDLVQAVESEARRTGSSILFVDARNDVEEERRVAATLLERRVDGILISPCHLTRSVALLARVSRVVPVVQLDRVVSSRIASVSVDQAGAMAGLAAIAREGGRSRAVFVGSDASVSTSKARQDAFVSEFREFEAGGERVLVGEFSVEWGREAAHRLAAWPDVDVVVCASDLIAFGLIQELSRLGIRVPEDVAVSGWDDTILATANRPAITSVRQPIAEMARCAVELIGAGPSSARDAAVLGAEVIARDSTGGDGSAGVVADP